MRNKMAYTHHRVFALLGAFIFMLVNVDCSSIVRNKRDSIASLTSVSVFPEKLTVLEGTAAEFYCHTNSSNDVVTWYRKGKQMAARPGRIVITSGNDGDGDGTWSILRIESASRKHHRKSYRCAMYHSTTGETDSNSANLIVVNQRDNIPGDLQAAYVELPSKVKLTWTPADPKDRGKKKHYEMVYKNTASPGPWESKTVPGWNESTIIEDLHTNTSYTFMLRYVRSDGNKVWPFSEALEFTTLSVSDTACVDFRGGTVREGDSYDLDPCKRCVCVPGNSTEMCAEMFCDVPPCPNYRLIPDTCCGFECIDSIKLEDYCMASDGQRVDSGESYTPYDDPCLQCTCMHGEWERCMTPMCRPHCSNFIVIPGTCCQYNCTEPAAIERGCINRDGLPVPSKALFKPKKDPCVTCRCDNGQSEFCVSVSCHMDTTCRNYTISTETCCNYTCHDQTPPMGCTDRYNNTVQEGSIFYPYDDPCTQCECWDSQPRNCFSESCEFPECLNYTGAPDKCCVFSCHDNNITGCVNSQGQKVQVGETFEAKPCLDCLCLPDGSPGMCNEMICDEPPCPNYNLIPDTCCGFECLDNHTDCVDRRGERVRVGDIFEAEMCVHCECLEGNVKGMCAQVACAEPQCRNYRLIPDTCCGFECIDPDNYTARGCIDWDGIPVPFNASFKPQRDPCVRCHCVDGEAKLCVTDPCYVPCQNYTLSTETCCDFTCHDRTNNTSKLSLPIELDVRQVGSSLAIVQWNVTGNAEVDQVLYKLTSERSWSAVRTTSGEDMHILQTLSPDKTYQIKVAAYDEAAGRDVPSPIVIFSFEPRLTNMLPLSSMKGHVIDSSGSAYPWKQGTEEYINFNAYTKIDVIEAEPSRCTSEASRESDCGSIYVYMSSKEVRRFRFTNKMDFKWAAAHI